MRNKSPFLFLLILAITLPLGSCSTTPLRSRKPKVSQVPVYRIFVSTFDRVWQAAVYVLDSYTVASASRDSGLITTDWVEQKYNPELFEFPFEEPPSEEVKYRLVVKLSKAIVKDTSEPAVRVQITKTYQKYGNILTSWIDSPSDLIEEKVLLYRVGRRLGIVETLSRKTLSAQ